jgi:hypothetical protein
MRSKYVDRWLILLTLSSTSHMVAHDASHYSRTKPLYIIHKHLKRESLMVNCTGRTSRYLNLYLLQGEDNNNGEMGKISGNYVYSPNIT